MLEPHHVLNEGSTDDARRMLGRCCGATRWVEGMVTHRPFSSTEALLSIADEVWAAMSEADVLEAFEHHPQIGEDLEALREKFSGTLSLSSSEQSGVAAASQATLEALRDGNRAYREHFGFIFIVCASGKSADEMLGLLQTRLANDRATELSIAAGEQAKITRLRLHALAR